MIKSYLYWNKIKNIDGTITIIQIPLKINLSLKQTTENNSIWIWKKLQIKRFNKKSPIA